MLWERSRTGLFYAVALIHIKEKGSFNNMGTDTKEKYVVRGELALLLHLRFRYGKSLK